MWCRTTKAAHIVYIWLGVGRQHFAYGNIGTDFIVNSIHVSCVCSHRERTATHSCLGISVSQWLYVLVFVCTVAVVGSVAIQAFARVCVHEYILTKRLQAQSQCECAARMKNKMLDKRSNSMGLPFSLMHTDLKCRRMRWSEFYYFI